MSKFEDACRLSCENWVDSFPTKVPKHKFSKKHKKRMKEIFEINAKPSVLPKKIKFSKKTFKFFIIAAIFMSFSITAFAVNSQNDFNVIKFQDHSEYEIVDVKKSPKVKSLTVNYIPEGFEQTKTSENDYVFTYEYEKGEDFFIVDKVQLEGYHDFDTEEYDCEMIEIRGMDAILFRPDEDFYGIIFNNGKYLYTVAGTIDTDELIKIAEGVDNL